VVKNTSALLTDNDAKFAKHKINCLRIASNTIIVIFIPYLLYSSVVTYAIYLCSSAGKLSTTPDIGSRCENVSRWNCVRWSASVCALLHRPILTDMCIPESITTTNRCYLTLCSHRDLIIPRAWPSGYGSHSSLFLRTGWNSLPRTFWDLSLFFCVSAAGFKRNCLV